MQLYFGVCRRHGGAVIRFYQRIVLGAKRQNGARQAGKRGGAVFFRKNRKALGQRLFAQRRGRNGAADPGVKIGQHLIRLRREFLLHQTQGFLRLETRKAVDGDQRAQIFRQMIQRPKQSHGMGDQHHVFIAIQNRRGGFGEKAEIDARRFFQRQMTHHIAPNFRAETPAMHEHEMRHAANFIFSSPRNASNARIA